MSDDHITLPDDEPEPPTDPSPTEGAAESPPEPSLCAECGGPLEEGQPYCLDCGAPTPDAPKLRGSLGPAGILALGLVVLGIGAGALAYAIANEDETTAGTATAPVPPTLTGVPSLPSVPTFPTTPSVDLTETLPTLPTVPTTTGPGFTQTGPITTFPGTTTGPTTETVPPPTTAPPVTTGPPPSTTIVPPSSGGADTWPDGTSGWTVILASTSSRSDAAAFRDKVQRSGRSAGLIDSSQYSTLEPGLWVVFTSQYQSRTQAINQAAALRRTYPGAYAQRIEEG